MNPSALDYTAASTRKIPLFLVINNFDDVVFSPLAATFIFVCAVVAIILRFMCGLTRRNKIGLVDNGQAAACGLCKETEACSSFARSPSPRCWSSVKGEPA